MSHSALEIDIKKLDFGLIRLPHEGDKFHIG